MAVIIKLALATIFISWIACFVKAATACSPGQASTSGVIQLTASSCLPESGSIYKNHLLGLCGPAFKVDVNSKGHIYMTPLQQGQVKWTDGGKQRFFECSNMNATGVYNGTSTLASASVMFYTNVQGAHSKLVVIGTNNLTLVAGNTQYDIECTYNFKVVSGCVMGIQSSTPHVCPSGWHIKANTKYGIKYCAPCPLGTTSSGPGATKCTPCPAGYAGGVAGGQCQKCDGYAYTSKPGMVSCDECFVFDWRYNGEGATNYTDGRSCKRCPPDSRTFDSNPSQCVACNNGIKCCRTNPSKDCPPCKPGFKSVPIKPATFIMASAHPPACLKTKVATCTASFTVTVTSNCQVQLHTYTPVTAEPCLSQSNNTASVMKSRASASDIPLFLEYSDGPANVSSISRPFVTFKVQAPDWSNTIPKVCKYTFRSISAAGALLGVPPAPCRPGTPGCVSKARPHRCPAGYYVQKNIDGNTLCLPCPAGTYAKSANSATRCTPCPAGKYAMGYGNSKCSICPAGSYSYKGATQCNGCSGYHIPGTGFFIPGGYYSSKAGSGDCKLCPLNTFGPSLPASDRVTRCLGRVNGIVCCAAGDCSGQPACPKRLLSFQVTEAAIFQLNSKSLADSSCRNATILKCLSSRALVALKPTGGDVGEVQIDPYNQPGCNKDGYAPQLRGHYVATNHAELRDVESTYEAFSYAKTGTMKIFFSPEESAIHPLKPSKAKCSATFKLIAGYAFDLKPPKVAKCPVGSKPTNNSGAISCFSCFVGNILKGGKCQQCPAGTYQPTLGGTKCYPCQAGYRSYAGSVRCSTCTLGTAPNSQGKCIGCPTNTYTLPGFLKCKACPAGLVAAKGSTECGVPFPTK